MHGPRGSVAVATCGSSVPRAGLGRAFGENLWESLFPRLWSGSLRQHGLPGCPATVRGLPVVGRDGGSCSGVPRHACRLEEGPGHFPGKGMPPPQPVVQDGTPNPCQANPKPHPPRSPPLHALTLTHEAKSKLPGGGSWAAPGRFRRSLRINTATTNEGCEEAAPRGPRFLLLGLRVGTGGFWEHSGPPGRPGSGDRQGGPPRTQKQALVDACCLPSPVWVQVLQAQDGGHLPKVRERGGGGGSWGEGPQARCPQTPTGTCLPDVYSTVCRENRTGLGRRLG